MKKQVFVILLLLICNVEAFSQIKQSAQQSSSIIFKSKPHNGYIRCATMEADSIRRANNPNLGSFESNQLFIQKQIQNHKAKHGHGNQQKLPVLVIPCVVHVIHNGDALGTGENILDGQAISQIQVLNEDFRRILGTPGFNNHVDGADVEIEFCMAVVDPTGNATNGVNHVNYGQATFNSMADIDGNLKPATQWDPTQYMNMWTVRFGGGMNGTLGYAQFPSNSGLAGLAVNGGAANSDGVVSAYDVMGSENIFSTAMGGIYNPTYNLGRTMTHEVGHWLGLRHIWGDGGCGVDDFCADTPDSDASNFGCVNPPSCGTADMVENYMDYTDDACMNIFTQDQKTRIRQVMLNSPRRMELSSSTKCTAPNADDGGISAVTAPSGGYCGQTDFDPIVVLNNYGNNDITAIDIVYDVDGGTALTFSWTGTLTPGSTVSVTLPTLTVVAGAHTLNVSTNLPNGNTDTNAGNDGTSSNFTVTIGNPVDIALSTDCWGYETFWELYDASTNTLLSSGGNTGTTIPPGGGGTAANTDAGAYPSQANLNGQFCLSDGCYDFIIYDDFGDGMEGIAAGGGCTVDGSFTLTDATTSTVLASYTPFTTSDTSNFCVGTTCTTDAGTMDMTSLSICGTGNQTAIHNGDNVNDGDDALQYVLHDASGTTIGTSFGTSNTPTFSFGGAMVMGTIYYVSAISGNDLGAGVVDQTDVCFSVSAGTPVVWNALPTVVANATDTNPCLNSPITLTGSGASTYTWNNGVSDGTPTTPLNTTYIVTGTDGNGCTNTDNIVVTVNALPSVVANSSATVVCTGQTITLSGSGASTYTWDNGVSDGATFTPTATTYTVTGTDGNGCVNTDAVAITVNTLPTVSANSSATSVCPTDQITLTGSGTGGVTYIWDNGVTNGNAFTPSTTTYNVIGTDGNGCTNSASIAITVNALPTVVANASSNTVCAGDQIALTGSGASAYTWDNGVTDGNTFTPISTTYTVTGTDVNGCVNTDNITITVNNLPLVVANSSLTTICSGQAITLTGSGATSYTWNNGASDGSPISPTSSTTFIVTGTDANGCTNTDNISITVNALPTITANSTSTSVCPTEQITLTGSGASTYIWNNGVTNGNAFTPVSTTYTVTGTDANGCSNVDNIAITVNPLPNIIANASTTTVCSGSSLILTGSGGVSYLWDNGALNNIAFNPTANATYTVTGTDANGCVNTDMVSITMSALPTITNLTETCNGTNTAYTVSFDINGGAGGYVVTGQSGSLTGATWTSTAILSGSAYNIMVTDANGCSPANVSGSNNCSCTTNSGTMNTTALTLCGTGNQTAIHNSNEVLDGNDVIEFVLHTNSGATLGSIINTASTPQFNFGGAMTMGTTYYISAIAGNDNGSGSVDQTDGCLSVSAGTPVTWYANPTITANASVNALCIGNSLVLTGAGASSYVWSNGVNNAVAFNPVMTTTYTVTGTDANNCSGTDNVTITVNALPTVTANATDTDICAGSSVTLSGGGAATYVWSNSVMNGNAFVPSATINYVVTGTDGNGCENTDNITVNVNALPTVIANATTTTICDGDLVTLTGSGASTYIWDNGVSDGDAVNPTTNTTYTVTGTDANNCTNTDNVSIVVNPNPVFTISSNDPTTCGGNEGEITLSGLNSTTTYNLTYTGTAIVGPSNVVSDGTGNLIITGLTAGNYTDVIVELNGCSTPDNSNNNLSDPVAYTLGTTVNDENCNTANGEIDITVIGGAPAIQYSINNGGTFVGTNVFSNLSAGTYDIVVIDGNNCQDQTQVVIANIAGPIINSVTVNQPLCFGETGAIVIDATGNSTLAYNINNGTLQSSPTFSGLTDGVYLISVSDLNNCSVDQTATINVPNELSYNAIETNSFCGNSIGSVSLSINGGVLPYQISWAHDSNLTNDTIVNLNSGVYDFTITDFNGCLLSGSSEVVGSSAIDIETTFINESCIGVKDASAEVTEVIGGLAPFSYQWGNGSTSSSISDLNAGIYQVTVSDFAGCTVTKTINVETESDECLNIHNAFSPNSDGENDFWVITGIDGYPENSVKIFNRWGSLVFEAENYDNDWGGTYKGKDLPAGVYFYIVRLSDEESYDGSLTILR